MVLIDVILKVADLFFCSVTVRSIFDFHPQLLINHNWLCPKISNKKHVPPFQVYYFKLKNQLPP